MSSKPQELQFLPVAEVLLHHDVWDVEARRVDQFSGIDLVNRQMQGHTVKAQIRLECEKHGLSVEESTIPVERRGTLKGVFTQRKVEEGRRFALQVACGSPVRAR